MTNPAAPKPKTPPPRKLAALLACGLIRNVLRSAQKEGK